MLKLIGFTDTVHLAADDGVVISAHDQILTCHGCRLQACPNVDVTDATNLDF